jgi:hypothetical protein
MKKQGILIIGLLLAACSQCFIAYSQQAVVGTTTWVVQFSQLSTVPVDSGYVHARGYGSISPKEMDRAKAYIKARDVAYANALSGLVMRLKGAQLKSRYSVRDYEATGQSIDIEMEGIVQGADMLSERVVQLFGAPAVEVVAGVRSSDVMSAPAPPARERTPDVRREKPSTPPVDAYTSVIIDARGLGLRRSMSPHILWPDGNVLWGNMEVDPDFVVSEGIALYARNLSAAYTTERTGGKPLVLRAIGVRGSARSDVVLSEDIARQLLEADRRYGLLKSFRVIFVVD